MNKKFVTLAVAVAIAIPGMTMMPALADDEVPTNEVPTVEVTEPAVDAVEAAEAAPQSDAAEPAEVSDQSEAAPAGESEAEETAEVVAAEEAPAAVTAERSADITPAEAQGAINDINAAVATLKEIQSEEPKADWSKEFDKLFATAAELTQSLAVVAGGYQTLANPDLIMARTHLIVEIGLTVDKSANNLRYKIQKAHVELGFAVTRAIMRVANIGATEYQLNDSISDLRATYDRVSTYRDLKSTDTATIYVKDLLNKAIWNTRVARDKEILTHKNFRTYYTLNKEITKAVGVWFKAKATVADCDAAIARLNSAYATAYAAPSVR